MVKFNKRFLTCLGIVFLLTSIFPTGTFGFAQDESFAGINLNDPILLPQLSGQAALLQSALPGTGDDGLPVAPSLTSAEDALQTFFPTILNGAVIVSQPDVEILTVSFPIDNKTRHHTTDWPDFVFRRVQWLTIQVGFSGNFQVMTDSFSWSVMEPGQVNYQPIPVWTPELPDTSWAVRELSTIAPYHTVEIFIPVGAALGEHRFGVSLYREMLASSALQDLEFSPSFFVIFNPFNDDSDLRKDSDVYNYYFSPGEATYYSLAGYDRNFYGEEYIDMEPFVGGEVIWVLNMFDPIIFLPVMAEVQGVRSAKDAVRLLAAKDRYNHVLNDVVRKDSDIIYGEWRPGYTHNWQNAPAMMTFWNWGAAHPTGQCMDFGGLLAAMVRAIGVPERLVTCAYCLGYEFHVWNEVWLNEVNPGAWSAVDGMADYGPSPRSDPYFQNYVGSGTAVYTWDARYSKRIDVKNKY